MKIRLICFLLSILFFPSFIFGSTPTHNLALNIVGLKQKQGVLNVGIYKNKDNWLKDNPYIGKRVHVQSIPTQDIQVDVPPGSYSIAIYHDINNNGRLDTGLFGIPTEPTGTSNNERGFMGPPSFEKNNVTISNGDTSLEVILE
jgi:uncharacterized protein (DUF2141 family)